VLNTDSAAGLMAEMSMTAEHHGYAAFVSGGNHFVIAHAAAGLDHGDGAGVSDDIQAIAKWKKRV